MMINNRNTQRYSFSLPVELMFGTQFSIKGQIKDLSLKSAFIQVKSSVHMAPNDEMQFAIGTVSGDTDNRIKGSARISRVAPGEGIAIYFIQIEKSSVSRLEQLLGIAPAAKEPAKVSEPEVTQDFVGGS